MSAAAAETYLLDVQRLLFMANPSAPYFGIWRLFIDESRTKINDFYEIDDINIFWGRRFRSDCQTIYTKNESQPLFDAKVC